MTPQQIGHLLLERMQQRQRYEDEYGLQMPPTLFVHGESHLLKINLSTRLVTPRKGADFWFFLGDFGRQFFESVGSAVDLQVSTHPAASWFRAYETDVARHSADPQKVGKTGLGGMIAWLRLCYDIFTVSNNCDFPAPLKERLLSPLYFQGARHELRVAAACISAGFRLEFEDESKNSTTHLEFVARSSSVTIAVEAKSRHRSGIQGFTTGHPVRDLTLVDLRRDVRSLVLDAYKKKTELPFYVFVDVNLPEPPEYSIFKRWTDGIVSLFSDLEAEGLEDPSPANAVIFTNDGTHYYCDTAVPHDYFAIWALERSSKNPKQAHPSADFAEFLTTSYSKRLVPPPTFRRIEVPIAKPV
jgi:hypothetical protein